MESGTKQLWKLGNGLREQGSRIVKEGHESTFFAQSSLLRGRASLHSLSSFSLGPVIVFHYVNSMLRFGCECLESIGPGDARPFFCEALRGNGALAELSRIEEPHDPL
jgi:hypothetical protein